LRLETATAEGTPDVSADAVAIGSALTNLLSNALKYTPGGGEVKVAATADGTMVRFSVTDSGPGIPEPFQSRIFEKFFRVPSPSGPTGAGLGLSIVKEIVEAHGGQVGFQVGAEGGCTFYFLLAPAA
jgi:signal transduction histidine kinase